MISPLLKKSIFRFSLITLILLIAFVLYSKGLGGGFIFDDYPNIVQNDEVKITSLTPKSLLQAFQSGLGGIFNRSLSMLSFGINHNYSQLNPYDYKITNVIIHITNSLSIGILIYLILSSTSYNQNSSRTILFYISLLTATLWLYHPYNLTTTLYVVQRMTSLSAFFVIWSLIFYLTGRQLQFSKKNIRGWLYIFFSLILIVPGFLCKENAGLTPLFLLLIEVFLLKFYYKNSNIIIPFFFLAIVGIPFVGILVYIIYEPDFILKAYSYRSFNLIERVLTETRVILIYLGQIILPNPQTMGVYIDDITISKSIISPITTLLSFLSILLILVVSWLNRNTYPVISFGIFFFFTGHLLESTFYPLELIFEHRNYLPSLGIILSVSLLLLDQKNKTHYKPTFKSLIFSVWFIFCFFVLFIRIDSWSSPLKLAITQVTNHPNSSRSHYMLAEQYSKHLNNQDYVKKTLFHFDRSAQLDKKMISALISQIYIYNTINQDVPKSLIQEIENRLKTEVITASTLNRISWLTNCLKLKQCTLTKDQYLHLINNLLANTNISKAHRGIILKNLSVYYGLVLNNIQKALYYSQLAVTTHPSPESWLNYASWLANSQLLKESLNALKKGHAITKNKYKLQEFEKSIQIIQSQLSHKPVTNSN